MDEPIAAQDDDACRLDNVLDKVLGRLAALEKGVSAVRREQDRQDLIERYTDSTRELGRPFHGVRLCGLCVQLLVHDPFDARGFFSVGSSDDMIVVVNECDLMSHFRSHVWTRGECVAWKWDEDILQEWGTTKSEDVRLRMLAWYRHDQDRPDAPSTEDVGAGPSHHPAASDAIHEAALRRRHPGLIAIGREGLAVTKSCGIGGAVALMDAVASDLGCRTKMDATFRVFRITAALRPLAIAVLAEGASGRNPQRRAAWDALPEVIKKNLVLEQCMLRAFFTKEKLARCRGLPPAQYVMK